jgi:predicted secreted hydrolase
MEFFVRHFINSALAAAVLAGSLTSCSSDIINPGQQLTGQVNSQSVQDAASDRSASLKQAEMILEKYPEAKSIFLDWKPENNESLDFKKDLARDLLNSAGNTISRSDLAKISETSQIAAIESYEPINFAKDQGEHKGKLSEWWYYNGHLSTAAGKKYGYELTFFRSTPFIYFAHVAVTDENNHKFNFVRKFYSPRDVKTSKTSGTLNFENQSVQQTGDFSYKLQAEAGPFKFNLNLDMEKGPLIINGNGLIDMPEGTNSYYYSLTRLKTQGTITENGQTAAVTGQSWQDHQWGNFVSLRIGWDWFSLQLQDNTEYNLFSFRNKRDQTLKQFVNVFDDKFQASHDSNGFTINRLDWWNSPDTSDLYVTKWQVELPQRNEKFIIEANVPGQEVFASQLYDIAPTYWEGSCKVTKIRADGTQVPGMAYVEHFPYQNKIQ